MRQKTGVGGVPCPASPDFARNLCKAEQRVHAPEATDPETSPFEARLQILRRFAVDRQVLIQELGEVFKIAASEGWSDADTRKTLQVIERRQRNRADSHPRSSAGWRLQM